MAIALGMVIVQAYYSLDQFSTTLKGHDAKEVTKAHEVILAKVIEQINGILVFGGNGLINIGSNYYVRPIGNKAEIYTPTMRAIDYEYIKAISSRAMEDIERGEYDSEITKSRTLLEEVFFAMLLWRAMKFQQITEKSKNYSSR